MEALVLKWLIEGQSLHLAGLVHKERSSRKKKHMFLMFLSIETHYIPKKTTIYKRGKTIKVFLMRNMSAHLYSVIVHLHNFHSNEKNLIIFKMLILRIYVSAAASMQCAAGAMCRSVFCTHVQSGRGLCGF